MAKRTSLKGGRRTKSRGYYKGDKTRKGTGRKVTTRSRKLDRKRSGKKYEKWE